MSTQMQGNKLVDFGQSSLQSLSWIPSVIMICVVIIMIILLIVRLVKGGNQQKQFRDLINITPYNKELIWGDLPKSPTYNEYTITLSFKVDDWEYNYDKPKLIFYRGSKLNDGSLIVNPGVWIYPKTANLMVRISELNNKCQEKGCNFKNKRVKLYGKEIGKTIQNSLHDCEQHCINYVDTANPNVTCDGIQFNQFNEMPNCRLYGTGDTMPVQSDESGVSHELYYPRTFDSDPNNLLSFSANPYKQCDIKGIPIQTWVNLTLVYYNNQLDIYINGILKRSCTNIVSIPFKQKTNRNDNGVMTGSDSHDIVVNPEFKGEIKDMKYFDYSLNSTQIHSMFGLSNAKLRQDVPKYI